MPPVETERQINGQQQERRRSSLVHKCNDSRKARIVNEQKDKVPPPVLSDEPERELEKKLERHPDDADAKVDVGSDESMDASDPPAATQPGCEDEPVPSSGFPEDDRG